MTYGLYDSERRHRRRIVWRILKLVLAAIVFGGGGLFAYQLGVEHARTAETRLDRRVGELSDSEVKLRETITVLEGELQQERGKARGLEEKLTREIPSGDAKALIEQLAERIKAGIEPKRLAQVIAATQNQRNCQEPQSKRFIVQTPIRRGDASAVTFANDTITISAIGAPAKGATGPEAWFDPGQPIVIRISGLGAQPADLTGVLPISHTQVIKDAEYRFVFALAQTRGFVQIAAERCAFP
ncbi:MAG: hypothetical protein EXQ92_09075 [Alphaproteobacteria bacterium]|nr:hypothetical protein [Alphaproteobacteria bacterium]